jgi:hypothetical protein
VVDTIIVDTGTDIPASLTTIADYLDTEVAAILAAVDTEVAAIKAKTDNLPADPADASDIAASFTTVNTKLDTIDDLIDSEVGAISTNIDSLLAMTASGTTTGSPTTTSIQGTGAGLSSSNDVYNNQFLVACSGVLQGVAREITDYVGATKTFTTDEWPSALASGVTIRVVGKVEAAE